MFQDLQEEWQSLQETAIATLQLPASSKNCAPRLGALILPSFEDCWHYQLLTHRGDQSKSAIGIKTVWRLRTDAAKFRDPVTRLSYGPGVPQSPTFERFEIQVDQTAVENLISRATSIRIPAFVNADFIHLDGTTYQLTLGDSEPAARFKWWGQAPKGWEPLQALLGEFITLLE